MSPPTQPSFSQTIYDEMKDYEKRCNDRRTSLNAYMVLYETRNEKDEPIVEKIFMACETPTHVVVRFPTAVKIELLGAACVSIGKLMESPKIGEETDPEIVLEDVPAPAPRSEGLVPIYLPVPQPAPKQRRIPLIAGLGLCRVCKHSPFLNITNRCTGGGHRFDHDPASKRCENFTFP